MKRLRLLSLFILSTSLCVQAQNIKFYASNGARFMKNATDSLLNPFSGGFNAPQFSNIDIDGDGKQDLFVFDRTSNRVAVYLHTPNGYIHAPNYNGRFPFLTNWAILRDFNLDGKPDILSETSQDYRFLPDSLPHVQTSGLRIFVNKSTPLSGISFTQINNQVYDTGGYWADFGVFRSPERLPVNNSDIPAIVDMDGDQDPDILSFTLTDLSPYYFENFLKNKYNIQYKQDSSRYIFRDQCWGYMQYDAPSNRNQFKIGMSKDQLSSCAFQMYEKKQKHSGTTLCPLDYNNDGVLDYLYGDVGFSNLLLLTNKKNSLGRDSIISQDSLFPANSVRANFIMFPAAYYVDINADGKSELLVTTNEPYAAKSKENVWIYNNSGTNTAPIFNYSGNDFWLYNTTIDLGSRAAPILIDVDSDGDEDLIVATSGSYDLTFNINDKLVLYTNTPDPVTRRSVFTLQDSNFLNISANGPMIHIVPTAADLNGDGKKDIILGMENGELLMYENTGTGSTVSFTRQSGSAVSNIDAGAFSAPAFSDLDKDGDLDLVIGNRNGILKLYMNRGNSANALFDAQATIDTFGKVNTRYCHNTTYDITNCESWGYATPVFYDIDGDSTAELIVGSDIGYVDIYKNIDTLPGTIFTKQNNVFVDFSNGLNPVEKRHGRFSTVCIGLMDGDNKPDMLIGNIAGGFQFYGSIPLNSSALSETLRSDRFVLYPNPAQNEVVLKYLDIPENGNVFIYDQIGRLIKRVTINRYVAETKIDISELQSGVYFIEAVGEGYKQTKKLIVQ